MKELNEHYRRVDEDMKFEALTQLRAIQSNLVGISFLQVLAIMKPSNKLKQDILAFQDELDDLTDKVGEFIRKAKEDVDYKTEDEPEDKEESKPEEPEEPKIEDDDTKTKEVQDSSKTKEDV